jgi:Flp pilus assembly protein TadD
MPARGLADAHRAVFLAPRSAAAHNMLATVLQASGDLRSARLEFEKAAALDGSSPYALSNLCYLSFLEGNPASAQSECEKALSIAPGFAAAHNNLALSFAARGDFDRARDEFLHSGDSAAAAFNLGIVYISQGQYEKAVESLELAESDPSLKASAMKLAHQATALADQGQSHGTNVIR